MSTSDDTSDRMNDIFVIELEVKYPYTCDGVKICNDRFIANIYKTIRRAPAKLTFRISFTSGVTSDLGFTFDILNPTVITTTAASTIATGERSLSE